MKRVHFFICGRVQGVGYRAWTVRTAKALALTGWVKNCADGSVEAVCEGESANVAEFLKMAKRGPALAHVSDVMALDEEFRGEFDDFSFRR